MNSVKHAFQSAKSDGADATKVQPSNWNAEHKIGVVLTNRTGGALASGDVIGLSAANDESAVLADTKDTTRTLLVAAESIADTVAGFFVAVGAWTVKVAGATTRGNFLAKDTTSKALYDTGIAAATNPPPIGAVAIALTGSVGAGTVVGMLLTSGGGGGFSKGADLASAATLAIPGSGTFFHVTGTTGITAFATRGAGDLVILKFDAALTITHNATSLILQAGASHTTEAGEVMIFVSEGAGNWREIDNHAHLVLANAHYVKGRTVQNEADYFLAGLDTQDRPTIGHGTPTASTTTNGALAGGEATVTVVSTAGFPVAGTAIIAGTDFFNYTGKTATTFTGCTGVAAHASGAAVTAAMLNIRVNGQLRCDIDAAARLVLPVGTNKWAVG